jgi:hypothetical protein
MKRYINYICPTQADSQLSQFQEIDHADYTRVQIPRDAIGFRFVVAGNKKQAVKKCAKARGYFFGTPDQVLPGNALTDPAVLSEKNADAVLAELFENKKGLSNRLFFQYAPGCLYRMKKTDMVLNPTTRQVVYPVPLKSRPRYFAAYLYEDTSIDGTEEIPFHAIESCDVTTIDIPESAVGFRFIEATDFQDAVKQWHKTRIYFLGNADQVITREELEKDGQRGKLVDEMEILRMKDNNLTARVVISGQPWYLRAVDLVLDRNTRKIVYPAQKPEPPLPIPGES